MALRKKESRYDILFTQEEKAEAFDQIAARFYAGNFGQMAKVDIETLLFHLYIDKCFDKKLDHDDYTVARELGITQSKVRNLKIRKSLQYPREEFKWEEIFVSCIPNAHYDPVKRLVKMHVADVDVLLELRNYMEKNGWYDEYQLNPKLFQCKTDIFYELCRNLEKTDYIELNDEAKKRLRKLKSETKNEKEASAIEKILSGTAEEGLKELLLIASKDVVLGVLRAIPMGGLAATAIEHFMKIVEQS